MSEGCAAMCAIAAAVHLLTLCARASMSPHSCNAVRQVVTAGDVDALAHDTFDAVRRLVTDGHIEIQSISTIDAA